MDANGRMQAATWLPSSVAHTGDVFAIRASGMKRDGLPIAGDGVTSFSETLSLDLDALQG
jgi:hypothetical protein